MALNASRPLSSSELVHFLRGGTNSRIILADFAQWLPPQQKHTKVHAEGSEYIMKNKTLQVPCGAVCGAAPRFLTTADYQSLSFIKVPNSIFSLVSRSNHWPACQRPTSLLWTNNQRSLFISDSFWKCCIRWLGTACWWHGHIPKLTQARKSQSTEHSWSLMDNSLPRVYIQSYPLPGVSLISQIELLVQFSSFPQFITMPVLR